MNYLNPIKEFKKKPYCRKVLLVVQNLPEEWSIFCSPSNHSEHEVRDAKEALIEAAIGEKVIRRQRKLGRLHRYPKSCRRPFGNYDQLRTEIVRRLNELKSIPPLKWLASCANP